MKPCYKAPLRVLRVRLSVRQSISPVKVPNSKRVQKQTWRKRFSGQEKPVFSNSQLRSSKIRVRVKMHLTNSSTDYSVVIIYRMYPCCLRRRCHQSKHQPHHHRYHHHCRSSFLRISQPLSKSINLSVSQSVSYCLSDARHRLCIGVT